MREDPSYSDCECCCCCIISQTIENTPTSTFVTVLILAPSAGIGIMIYSIIEIGVDLLTFYSIIFLFLDFAILIIIILFAIFFKYWGSHNLINTTKKILTIKMCIIGIFLSIACLICSGIAEFLILTDRKQPNCKETSNNDKYKICGKKDLSTVNARATFSNFSLVEGISLVILISFYTIKKRLKLSRYEESEEGGQNPVVPQTRIKVNNKNYNQPVQMNPAQGNQNNNIIYYQNYNQAIQIIPDQSSQNNNIVYNQKYNQSPDQSIQTNNNNQNITKDQNSFPNHIKKNKKNKKSKEILSIKDKNFEKNNETSKRKI